MGIKDRDYWEDAPGDWDSTEPTPKRWRRRRPWTVKRILAWASILLILAAIVLVAALRPR